MELGVSPSVAQPIEALPAVSPMPRPDRVGNFGGTIPYSESDPTGAFLDQLDEFPVIKEKEVQYEFFKRIEAGLYARQLLGLTKEELVGRNEDGATREELELLAVDGAEAREVFFKHNIRLIVSVAKGLVARNYEHDLKLLDLVNAGAAGLYAAIDKFDMAKGLMFSTYATWWIQKSIRSEISEDGRLIRLPTHVVEEVSKMRRIGRQFAQKHGREATSEEMAAALDCTLERVGELRGFAAAPLSLQRPVVEDGAENDATVETLLVEDGAISPAGAAGRMALRDTVRAALDRALEERVITPKQHTHIRYAFGFTDGRKHTGTEAGAVFGCKPQNANTAVRTGLERLGPLFERLDLKGAFDDVD